MAEVEEMTFFTFNTRGEVVEDVEVALSTRGWLGDARAFKVVLDGLDAVEPATVVELELGVVAIPRGVLVPDGMCVSKGLEDELGVRFSSTLSPTSALATWAPTL